MTKDSDHSQQRSPDLNRIFDTLRSKYWCWTLSSTIDGAASLLELLHTKLTHISHSSWAERFDFGGIYINGAEIIEDQLLPFPCKVEYYEPKFEIAQAAAIFPRFEERYIVYHDDAIAVVYKPPGLSSMPAKEQRHYSLKAALDNHFNTRVHMPSRLDVSAQGLVVVSINSRAHAALQKAFESRAVEKSYYLATAANVPWDTKTVALAIARDKQHPVLRTVSTNSGQSALTHLSLSHRTHSDGLPITVLKALPVTGRTHQIRVHAASLGVAILGDNFYGGAIAPYLHLVSFGLRLQHPSSAQALSISLPDELRPEWLRAL